MIHLLVLREHLKNIYQKYSRFLDSLFRFVPWTFDIFSSK